MSCGFTVCLLGGRVIHGTALHFKCLTCQQGFTVCFARALGEDERDICVKHEDSPWHRISVHCPDAEALPGPLSELLLPFLVALVSHLIPVTGALWAYFLSFFLFFFFFLE